MSVGLAAAGTASLHAAYTPEAGDNSKLWTLSATLRGFYDDNYNTAHSNVKGSFGAEVSPQFTLNVPLSQTELGMRYTYGLYYYQERQNLGQNPYDQTHQLDLWLDHAFNARWSAKLQDSVVVSKEPDLRSAAAVPQRTSQDSIGNRARLTLDTDWTRLFSTELSYQNGYYYYLNNGGNAGAPSLAGLLNRDENLISIDFKWNVKPTTVLLVGYQYGQNFYTGNEAIGVNPITGNTDFSSVRDSLSHYVYVGVQHAFLENLSGSAKVGAQYVDNYNDFGSPTSFGPYLDASLIYTYSPGSYAQIGVTHSLNNATAVSSVSSTTGRITDSQESSVVYGSVNYQVTSKLTASAVAHFEYDTYDGGNASNQSDQLYDFGLNLSYSFARHFSAEAGYNFDYYTSAIPLQSYTRDRVYLGLTASY
ncbi:MAG TPA: outer membrane beta-barrel protein [Dongiaceae bacterium]|nr:outer membrane beta-barrel protein [Dongiaceae bacterium]